jgi:hypothetical protein
MSHAASVANKVVSLSSVRAPRSEKVPKHIRKLSNALSRTNSDLKSILSNPLSSETVVAAARSKLTVLKKLHRKLVRRIRLQKSVARDSELTTDSLKLSEAV